MLITQNAYFQSFITGGFWWGKSLKTESADLRDATAALPLSWKPTSNVAVPKFKLMLGTDDTSSLHR